MDAAQSSGQTLVILNPAANRGNMHRHRAAARQRAEQEHAEYVETRLQGEAKERAMQAAGEDRPVIIVGGDGSVDEAVDGILASDVRVPAGSGGAGCRWHLASETRRRPRR